MVAPASPHHAAVVEDGPDQAGAVAEFPAPCFGAADQVEWRGGMFAQQGRTQHAKAAQQPGRRGVRDRRRGVLIPLWRCFAVVAIRAADRRLGIPSGIPESVLSVDGDPDCTLLVNIGSPFRSSKTGGASLLDSRIGVVSVEQTVWGWLVGWHTKEIHMINERNHVGAQTHPTAAQRRAARLADATVLANRTFGREAIAALQGQWHADTEGAELRYTLEGQACRLVRDAAWPLVQWRIGQLAGPIYRIVMIRSDAPPAVAAVQLQVALDELRLVLPPAAPPDHQACVFDAIRTERERQNATWGEQNHDAYTWLTILGEEFGELSQAILHATFGGKAAGTLLNELVHVVTVGVQWLECIERMQDREGQAS